MIDQLRKRLNIRVDDGFERLPDKERKRALDAAIGELVVPQREKEAMLQQLTTQVHDLERFIDFLQGSILLENIPYFQQINETWKDK